MPPTHRPDGTAPWLVELSEWDYVGPSRDARLKGLDFGDDLQFHQLAETLRGRLDIRQGYGGLEISSTSFVGRVDLGPLRIAIKPKLPAMPLTRLLRYAYGLRDVTVIEETQSPTTRHGFHELLISLLAAEVEELVRRGLPRRYISVSEKLESPRGQILVNQLIRDGGVREARLPCLHFERRTDWHLNRVLRAGIESAAQLAEGSDLRRHLQRLSAMFRDVEPLANLGRDNIERAERGLTRLTATCQPALTIIGLLQDMLGLAFDSGHQLVRTPGFLFDMNNFFQRLLSRFLHDNLTGSRMADELAIRNLFAYATEANPRKRTAPAPRPDYAIFCNNELSGFLDAKYRDIWDKGLPADWLYQLSIYALASPCEVSVMLYASMSTAACDERVEVRQPVAWSSKLPASVIFRPVPLSYLAELVDPDRAGTLARARRQLANQLVVPRTHKHNLATEGPETMTRSLTPVTPPET
jgi:5-methylcytosine-specific restriction enzyme subunit McrC